MNRPLRIRNGLVAAGLGLVLAAGCEYAPPTTVSAPKGTFQPGALPQGRAPGVNAGPKKISIRRTDAERKAILDNSITLIKGAALQPGGPHFANAVKNLNQYFAGTSPAEYELDSAAREYLMSQLGPDAIKDFQGTEWTLRDTRHIEDCMMYYGIAKRVAGSGEDLARVRRVFDWVIRQVQLVPAGSFGSGRLGPAFARPYDVLVRGMATESEGTAWAERAWLFMALCRQLGIDSGLITYTKGNVVDAMLPQQDQTTPRKVQRPPVVWVCAVLIGDQAYLFDARLGLEVPGPGGQGVATLEQALADPSILERMNIPGLAPYSTGRAALLASPTKLGILIDSSPGYFSPKMRLLQRELAGEYRTILFSDPAAQRDNFTHVLGARAGAVSLWEVPIQVEARLFRDPEYVTAIQSSLFWFKPEFPLIYARVKQLRGELKEAIGEYVDFRLKVNLPFVTDKSKKTTISKEVQDGLNVYAAYYLALAQLENNNLEQAEEMFRQVLNAVPEPQPGEQHPYYHMFRWGANANLARIHEAMKNDATAIDYYTRDDPTSQHAGNLLRARELVWRNPMAQPAIAPPARP